jgi:hypothetical protein
MLMRPLPNAKLEATNPAIVGEATASHPIKSTILVKRMENPPDLHLKNTRSWCK